MTKLPEIISAFSPNYCIKAKTRGKMLLRFECTQAGSNNVLSIFFFFLVSPNLRDTATA